MKLSRFVLALSMASLLGLVPVVSAETKVELKGVHLCCGQCVTGVTNALKGVEGVKAACDRKAGTVTLTATDDAAAQKGLAALAAAGYHGASDSKTLSIQDDSGAAAGKVKSVTVTGVHNCCPACCRAIKGTVAKVAGVSGETAKPKETTFEVTGDFDAAELVKALNAAGFHAKVKK